MLTCKLCCLQDALQAWQDNLLGSFALGAGTKRHLACWPAFQGRQALLGQVQQQRGHGPRRYSPEVLAELKGVPVPTSAGAIVQLGSSRYA